MVPVRAVPFGADIIRLVFRPQFRNASRVPLLTLPILQLHGTDDFDIPFTMGQQLADVAHEAGASCFYSFVPLHGCGHLLAVREPGLEALVRDFLLGVPSPLRQASRLPVKTVQQKRRSGTADPA